MQYNLFQMQVGFMDDIREYYVYEIFYVKFL
jgi:hypothetical protein